MAQFRNTEYKTPMNRLRWTIAASLIIDIVAYLIVLLEIGNPTTIALAFMVAVIFAPGMVVIPLLFQSDRQMQAWPERILVGLSGGFALFLIVTLFASYLPGPLTQGQLLAFFGFFVLAAASVGWFKISAQWEPDSGEPSAWPWYAVIALATVLLTATYFRVANLDYAELQGDESKVLLHAVSVVQGDEDVLFLHRRGPTDVLPPAALATLGIPLTETIVRLPFALASILAVGMVFLLGRAIQGVLVAWLSGMLLATEGLFIAFARIVQYQAFIHLSAVCMLFILWRLCRIIELKSGAVSSRLLHSSLLLAALFLMAGLLTHYEAIVVVPPAAYLLWRMLRSGLPWPKLVRAMIIPTVGTIVVVLAFYVPFFLDPRFQETYVRYSGKFVGDFQKLYHHLPLLIQRGSLYNFYGGFLAILALLALYPSIAYLRTRKSLVWLGVLGTLSMAAAIFMSMPFSESHYGWTSLLVGAFLIIAVLTPKATEGERMLWLWLAPPMFLSIALILDPDLHFYNYFAPMTLLATIVLNAIWIGLSRQLAPRPAVALFGTLLLFLLLPRTIYAHQLFVFNQEEIQRNWQTQTDLPSWMILAEPEGHPIFGFPHNSGWKAVGMLYKTGVLSGSYNANVRNWITAWYTRGQEICTENPELVFIEVVERPDKALELQEAMGDKYVKIGQILRRGRPEIDIFSRTHGESAVLADYAAEDFVDAFDAELAGADIHLTLPELDPAIAPVSYQFGDELALTGYRLYVDDAKPGESLSLSLRWQVLRTPSQEYILFAQVLGEDAHKVGQRDTAIACNSEKVAKWKAGDVIVSHYRIPLVKDAVSGKYPLFFGLYGQRDGERLSIYDEYGNRIGDALTLTQIIVTE